MFERYTHIIPDFEAFQSVLETDFPVDLRINPLKVDPDMMRSRLSESLPSAVPFSWDPDMVRVVGVRGTGRTLEYFLGWYHPQGASSALAPVVLDPQPGEHVLDMCAAPGSKTTQIAARMENRGLVLANEVNVGRAGPLTVNAERLGVANIAVVVSDATSLPGGKLYDRVLVDAPCTGEGTIRQSKAHWATAAHRTRNHRLQVHLLRRAINMTRPGGAIVYSTCTYAPEEDEAVLHEILRKPGVTIKPIDLKGVDTQPGLETWENASFEPALSGCARVYPHKFDSYGFFICRLQKDGESEPVAPPQAIPLETADEIAEQALFFLDDWYGITPDDLAGYRLETHGKSVWIVSREVTPEALSPYRIQTRGLRLLRLIQGNRFKPTTFGMQFLGPYVRTSFVDLNASELWENMNRIMIEKPLNGQVEKGGFVLVRHDGHAIGCGLIDQNGLQSQIPKLWSSQICESLVLPGP